MRQLSLEDIVNHPKASMGCRRAIIKGCRKMRGRIAMNAAAHYIRVVRELLGDFCENYLEIGVLHGGSLILAMGIESPCTFVGVGIFTYYGKEKSGGAVVSEENSRKNIDMFNKFNHPYHLIKGDSTDADTKRRVYELLVPESVGFLFIDGSHRKEDVLNDWAFYSPLVKSGGVVVFDDAIDMYSRATECVTGVVKAIEEIDFSGYNRIGQVEGWYIVQKK